jgi:hypothetical protein
VRLEPWGEGDLPLLEKLMGDPAMTEHLGGPETPEEAEFEYPPSKFIRGNDWRLDLFPPR